MTTGTDHYNPHRSEGPDRFRNNPRCREFHDLKGTDLGGSPNACCCDPCSTVKPYEPNVIAAATAYRWCCRCVPRVIMLKFVPDDDTAECCQERGMMTVLFPNRPAPIGDETNLWTEYTGLALLNYAVTVRIGRLGGMLWQEGNTGTGTGSADQGRCCWHIVAVHDPSGTPETVYDEYIFIDDEYAVGYTATGTGTGNFTASCIKVPQVVIADDVMGFRLGTSTDACYGKLILADFEKDRLPFIERQDQPAVPQCSVLTADELPTQVVIAGWYPTHGRAYITIEFFSGVSSIGTFSGSYLGDLDAATLETDINGWFVTNGMTSTVAVTGLASTGLYLTFTDDDNEWNREFVHLDELGAMFHEAWTNDFWLITVVTEAQKKFQLSYGGDTTGTLSTDDSAATLHTALESLSSINSGNVIVSGSDGGPWSINWDGAMVGTATGPITIATSLNECTPTGEAAADQSHFVYLCGECDDDGTDSLISVAVDRDAYVQAADVNGKPSYGLDDWLLYWTGSRWQLDDTAPTGTLGDPLPMAYGPTTVDCPIGVWERTAAWTGDTSLGATGTGTAVAEILPTYFCVTKADEWYRQACGPCDRVCTKVCVRGPRHLTTDTLPQTFQVFEWFENYSDTGTGGTPTVLRGWQYDNPNDVSATPLWTDILYLEPDADYTVSVDGVEWARNYAPHSFGDPSRPYWYYDIGGQDAWLYWDGSNWMIMLNGNVSAAGPATDSPAGTYLHLDPYSTDYAVTISTPTLSQLCRIRPRFEIVATDELYPPTVIASEDCVSKELVEIRQTGDAFPYLRTLSVRCGFCECWQHVCGMCRCVPSSLCVTFYDGGDQQQVGTGTSISTGTLYSNLKLEWNEAILGWGDDDDPLRLLLIEDYKGDCAVDIDYGDYAVPTLPGHRHPNYPAYNCGIEGWYREMDDDVQFPAIVYSDFTNDRNLVVVALSHAVDCAPTPCTDATPCFDSCGGHPAVLYLDITVQPALFCCGGPAEAPIACPPIHLPTVTLNFIDTGGYFLLGLGVTFTCGYVGFLPAITTSEGTCCALWFYLVGGVLYIRGAETESITCLQDDDNQIDLEETCEPYSATGGPAYYSPNLIPYCKCLYPDYANNVLGPCSCYGTISVSIME